MIDRWDVITIGNLSRNRYWGESDDKPNRPTMCTSTLLRGRDFRLLVDPPIEDAARMAAEFNRRTGRKLDWVTHVFITHQHADHYFGLKHFPEAIWMAAPGVAAAINRTAEFARGVEGVMGRIFEEIEVLPTPGHTMEHHSLLFACEGRRVVVAGDAVMTRDFWNGRSGFFNSAHMGMAVETIERIAELADFVVPGHDNYFAIAPR
jgi:glyoxylase-like metal-dependent hydrolase (beta-lactamase superfamily II)